VLDGVLIVERELRWSRGEEAQMDFGLVLPIALVGLSNGVDFGYKRALTLENLPTTKITPPWINQVALAFAVVLTFVFFLGYPGLFTILDLVSMWLGFLVGYGVSAVLMFVMTRYFVRKRRPV
jgi:hypothetical protein